MENRIITSTKKISINECEVHSPNHWAKHIEKVEMRMKKKKWDWRAKRTQVGDIVIIISQLINSRKNDLMANVHAVETTRLQQRI
jgi:hypothetical protein